MQNKETNQPAPAEAKPALTESEPPVSSDEIIQRPLEPKRVLTSLALLLVSLAVLGFALFSAYRRSNNLSKTAFRQISLVKMSTSGKTTHAAISRDGKDVAYVALEGEQQSLRLRQASATNDASVVAPATVQFRGVTFSPDGRDLYYVAQPKGETLGNLYRVPVSGGAPHQIMADVGGPISFSPNGQYFVFVRDYPAQREMSVIAAKLDGTEERKLLTRKRPELVSLQGPAWSPDGQRIACAVGIITGTDSAMRVLVINLADGAEQQVGEQVWAQIGQVGWLGDGSGLVFNGWQEKSAVYGDQLWLLTFPRGEVRRVTNDMASYGGASVTLDATALTSARADRASRLWLIPANNGVADTEHATQIQWGLGDIFSERLGLDWMPDGRLIYASQTGGNLDIWAINTDGTKQAQPLQITRDPSADISPTASPDGRTLVFSSERNGTSNIWRVDADGANPKQLTHGKKDAAPAISADGKWVVYFSTENGKWALYKVPMDGGEPLLLAARAGRPVISPDGKWVACLYQAEAEAKAKIALIPFAGGEPKVIEQMEAPEFGLYRWTPDGRALTYIVTKQGVSNLWSSLVDGGEPKRLTDFTTDEIYRFAWSPDGKGLACERGVTTSDVVLIRNLKAE